MIDSKRVMALVGVFAMVAGVLMSGESAWAGLVITTEADPSAVIKPGENPRKPASEAKEKLLEKTTTVMKFQGEMMCIDRAKTLTIFNSKTSEQIEIRKEEKNYWKLTGAEFKEKIAKVRKMNGLDALAEPVKFVATGREEKIGEWGTKEYVASLPNEHTMTVWMTTEGDAEKARSQALEVYEKMSSLQGAVDWKTAPGYPIRTIQERPGMSAGRADAGKGGVKSIKLVQTVVSIKEEEVEEGVFKVPKGFMRVEAPKVGGSGVTAGKGGR